MKKTEIKHTYLFIPNQVIKQRINLLRLFTFVVNSLFKNGYLCEIDPQRNIILKVNKSLNNFITPSYFAILCNQVQNKLTKKQNRFYFNTLD